MTEERKKQRREKTRGPWEGDSEVSDKIAALSHRRTAGGRGREKVGGPTGRPQGCGSPPVVPGTAKPRAFMAKKPGARRVCQRRTNPAGMRCASQVEGTSAWDIQLDGDTRTIHQDGREFAMAMDIRDSPAFGGLSLQHGDVQLKCLKGPSVLSLSNMVSHHHSLDQSSFLLSVLSSSTGVPLSNNPRAVDWTRWPPSRPFINARRILSQGVTADALHEFDGGLKPDILSVRFDRPRGDTIDGTNRGPRTLVRWVDVFVNNLLPKILSHSVTTHVRIWGTGGTIGHRNPRGKKPECEPVPFTQQQGGDQLSVQGRRSRARRALGPLKYMQQKSPCRFYFSIAFAPSLFPFHHGWLIRAHPSQVKIRFFQLGLSTSGLPGTTPHLYLLLANHIDNLNPFEITDATREPTLWGPDKYEGPEPTSHAAKDYLHPLAAEARAGDQEYQAFDRLASMPWLWGRVIALKVGSVIATYRQSKDGVMGGIPDYFRAPPHFGD
ncbi:hypothetical protein M752DRAFT_321628 [Aspergillus phoenicis ATCC 13157]|nr:hypothetical protein M752DRAFT_321628 [Aspergillus phoenicis ATCC 13157]